MGKSTKFRLPPATPATKFGFDILWVRQTGTVDNPEHGHGLAEGVTTRFPEAVSLLDQKTSSERVFAQGASVMSSRRMPMASAHANQSRPLKSISHAEECDLPMTSNSSVSMIYNLKDALRRKAEFARQGAERFTRAKPNLDEFVSICRLFEGENAAELKQPL